MTAVGNLIDRFMLWGVEIPDPTLPGQTVKICASDDERDRLRTKFAAAAVTAG